MNKISLSIHRLAVNRQPLFLASIMLFFWTLFDGSVSYISPLAIKQAGFSDTVLGLIIGSSSITGAAFDFLLSKFLHNTHFRRVYLIMLVLCFTFPIVMMQAKTIWIFLLAMAIWGIYFDLSNFGTFDFVGRKIENEEHASSFGIINVFKSLGYMLAPLIIGLILSSNSSITLSTYILMIIFLSIACLFFILLVTITKKGKELIQSKVAKTPVSFGELYLWKAIGKKLFPVLTLTLFFYIMDSFFWTIGPLIAESYKKLHPFNGLFLTAYELPLLFIGWFIGNITQKFGKKRTAFYGFLIGSLFLCMFTFLHNLILIIFDVFMASIFLGLTIPALDGAYADYISETAKAEKEINALIDFSGNIAYIVGPISAGFLADKIGSATSFSIVGAVGVIIAIILIKFTPKKIHIIIANPSKTS